MRFSFDDFEVDLSSFELRCAGTVVPLEPQAFDVLVHLLRCADRVVPKEELLDEVWGSRFVSESALTTRIKHVRRALGDDGRSQRLIRTVHGRGYRFVGALRAPSAERLAVRPVLAASSLQLLERSASLAVLERVLDRACAEGRGSIVVVEGEAGLGKSSLVRAFAATTESAPVLLGGCDDLLSPRALGPIRDIARQDDGPLADAFSGDDDADAVLGAVLSVLERGPTVLGIEDVHWADDATLDLIRLLARRIEDLPTVLLLTYRPELGTHHPLWRVLGSLRGDHVERIALEPLTADAVAELARARSRSPDELYEVTRGNPFFVTEVLASADGQLPSTVRDAVLSRLVGLPTAAREVIDVVSVVPSRTERWLVGAVVSDPQGGLAEAEVAGVLGVDTEHVWFRHELARRAVEGSLPAADRIRLNGLVLTALAERPDIEPSRLVHHARLAGDVDRMRRYAAAAVDESIRLRSYRQTVDVVELLLENEDDALDDRVRAEAHLRRSYALYVLNRLEESTRSGRRAVEVAERRDPATLVDGLLILSRAAYWSEGPEAALECVQRAIALLEGHGDDALRASAYADLARAYSNLANVGIVAEPDGRVVVAAERALELADRLGRPDLRCHALQYLGSGRMALGDPRGIADLEEAVALAEIDPRDELPVRACVNASGSHFRFGQLTEAERYVALGLDRATGGEFYAGVYRLELTRAGILLASGRWDAAMALLVELVDRPGEPGIMRPLASSLVARLHARCGRPEEASAALDPAVALAVGSDDPNLLGPVAASVAELAWLRADRAIHPLVDRTLRRARQLGHGLSEAESVGYLRRAGHHVAVEGVPPGPWALALRGDHADASHRWSGLGERYEAAVERFLAGGARGRTAAVSELRDLGAVATVAALERAVSA